MAVVRRVRKPDRVYNVLGWEAAEHRRVREIYQHRIPGRLVKERLRPLSSSQESVT